jgi:hypothetical protein
VAYFFHFGAVDNAPGEKTYSTFFAYFPHRTTYILHIQDFRPFLLRVNITLYSCRYLLFSSSCKKSKRRSYLGRTSCSCRMSLVRKIERKIHPHTRHLVGILIATLIVMLSTRALLSTQVESLGELASVTRGSLQMSTEDIRDTVKKGGGHNPLVSIMQTSDQTSPTAPSESGRNHLTQVFYISIRKSGWRFLQIRAGPHPLLRGHNWYPLSSASKQERG